MINHSGNYLFIGMFFLFTSCLQRDDKKSLNENFSKIALMTGDWEGTYAEGQFYLNYVKQSDSVITGGFSLIRYEDTVVTNDYRIFYNGKKIQLHVGSYSFTQKVQKNFEYEFESFIDSALIFSSIDNQYPKRVTFKLTPNGGLIQRFEEFDPKSTLEPMEYVYVRKN